MIQSMTAFSRASAEGQWGSAVWEIRTVNHRYLEPSFRIPESCRELEVPLRERLRQQLNRGKLECSLRFQAGDAVETELLLNHALAKELVKAGEAISALSSSAMPLDTGAILRWPGVIDVAEKALAQTKDAVLSAFDEAVQGVIKGRAREGEALKNIILERCDNISTEVEKVKAIMPEILQKQREKICERFELAKVECEPERLEQELVMIAQKADIAEEIDRLTTHINEVRRVLDAGGAVGRRLDFLMQELNREANTLGSKSIDKETTRVAVELKVFIEQMREQVQNIE